MCVVVLEVILGSGVVIWGRVWEEGEAGRAGNAGGLVCASAPEK